MEQREILSVITEWCRITEKYFKMKKFQWLQIFENRGAAVGSSNTHPHCQVNYDTEMLSHLNIILFCYVFLSPLKFN